MLLIEELSVEVGDKPILNKINMDIPKGETHILFGPNGHGKTSLMMAIMGFSGYVVTHGKITFKGEDITHMPIHERARLGVGVSFQRPPTINGLKTKSMVEICAQGRQVDIGALAEKLNFSSFLNSILVAAVGSHLDVGSRVVLNAPETRAEIISRGISSGGSIIARGDLVGNCAGVKAHLECKGLILNNGLMQAIPELSGTVPGVEMSHEAAVGKIDQREIAYLMARGLDEDDAISTIVKGFLNVDIEGLPAGLQQRIDRTIEETRKDMM